MRRQLIAFAIGAGLAADAVAQTSTQASVQADQAQAVLLQQARMWLSRNRDYMVRAVLDKLFRIAPDHPEGLVLQARIQVRAGQMSDALTTLKRLRERYPGHAGVAQIEVLIRLKGPDKDKLAQVRELAKAGRAEEALAAFRALHGDIAPDDDLALQYWQLVAAAPNGWERARNGLDELSRESPENRRFRLALAEHLTSRPPIDRDALKTIIGLTGDPDFSRQARDAWRRVILGLDPVAESVSLFREYLAHEPNDSLVKERFDGIVKTLEARRRLLADPRYRAKLDGLTALDGGKLEEANERLSKALAGRPDDPEILGAMGTLRLRQGRHEEAQDYFGKAAKLDPAQRLRWTGMARTARYWGLLRQAGEAKEAKQFARAEDLVRDARAIDPREPNALLSLARIQAEQDRVTDAEKSYRAALALAPTNAGGWSGLIGLYLRIGRDADAQAMLGKLAPALRKEVDADLNPLRARMLRDRADRLLAQGVPDDAIATLETAIVIDLDDPWSRYDLARLYVRKSGQDGMAKAQALFDELLRRQPRDASALYAEALFQSGVERESDALLSLEHIAATERSANMTGLQRRLWTAVQSRRATMLAQAGLKPTAVRILTEAETALGNDSDLQLDIVAAWIEIGEADAARRLLATSALLAHVAGERSQVSTDWELRHAHALDRLRDDAELQLVLERLAAHGGKTGAAPTPQQADALEAMQLSLTLRRAEALRQSGHADDALRLLQAATPSAPERSARLLRAKADLQRTMGRPNEAVQAYAMVLAMVPGDQDAALSLIETLIEAGKPDQARQLIQGRLESPQALPPDMSASFASRLIDLGDHAAARRIAESALESAPTHPRLLALAGRIARQDGRTGQAIDYLQRALAAESQVSAQPGGRNDGAYRELADLLDRDTAWFSSALDWRSRAGSEGSSQYDARELTLEWKQGWRNGGRRFYRIDTVRLDSGALDLSDLANASTFGTVLLCQATCNSGRLQQEARGLAFSTGFESDTNRIDLGTTPLGFNIGNFVGGFVHKGDLGPFSYSVDLSRRAVTGSLLSYAGARDPNTGKTWGGVTATGVRFGLSKDEGGSFGAWSSLGLHQITGRNVQGNNRMQLMAGGYWRAINEVDRLLTFGMTGMVWHHSENAGEYTFGHGGYYSPQSFKSLSLPVTYGLRGTRLSLALRGAFAMSWSQTKSAVYYPTDAGLQAQAEALAAAGGADPHYSSGSSARSPSRSLAAAWEYQMSPRLFLGGRMELDRSADYTPNRLLLYLRYAVDRTAARPVFFPPEPVVPSSQY